MDKKITIMTMGKRVYNQVNSIIKSHHKAGHIRISDSNRITLYHLLNPQRDNRTAACHNVTITSTTNGSSRTLAKFTTLSNRNLLHKCFADTHSIDRISCLISRKDHNIFYPMLDSRKKNVSSTENISASSLHREKLTTRHLLESGGGKNVVNTTHSNIYRSLVADITDIELHLRILQAVTHIVLLLLITTENSDFLDVAVKKTT